MNLDHLTQEEKNTLQKFTKLFDNQNYKEALEIAESALSMFPKSKEIWHNQVGTLIFILQNDYKSACFHYIKALENGFDKEVCEYNIWEAAEEFYKSLKTEAGTFNAIMNTTDGTFSRANDLLNEYIRLFPDGQYIESALALNETFMNSQK